MHERRKDFISVSISGFSPDGPGHDRKAYDLLMQAESGLADITGSPHAPGRVGVSIVDIATGMFAYQAVLGSLIKRNNTGEGATIAVSLFDAVAEVLAVALFVAALRWQRPPAGRISPSQHLSLRRLFQRRPAALRAVSAE